ncbi:MAG: MCE family protein [Actinomycetota bacterium]|nr:MCE family protein [Actinomycetota bacterium]
MTPFRERNKTAIGAIGLTVILGSLGVAFNADKLPLIGGGTVYQADFSEAAGLRPQDEVRVAGVKVGKVIGLGLEGDHVVVRFRVKNVVLGDASRADIRIKTVLGRKFVALTPAGAGHLAAGATIPLARTSSPYDITDAFRGLATTVQQIDQQQLAKAFETLSATFRDTPADVRASLSGLSRLSRTIASRDQDLQRLLQHANGVTQVLAQRDQDLVAFLNNSNLVLEELRVRREAIHRLLVTTATLSDQLVALVRENRAHLAPALHSLRGVVQVLRNNQNNIDAALPRLAAFTRIFANNLGNGRWFDTFVQNLTSPTGFLPVGGGT